MRASSFSSLVFVVLAALGLGLAYLMQSLPVAIAGVLLAAVGTDGTLAGVVSLTDVAAALPSLRRETVHRVVVLGASGVAGIITTMDLLRVLDGMLAEDR